MNNSISRVDAEWIALNAFRGLTKIASKGDMLKSTYDNSMELGGALYPDLLGPDVSLLRRERDSDTAREYRQKADMLSLKLKRSVKGLELLNQDIAELEELLHVASENRSSRSKVDQLKKKLKHLSVAKNELSPATHSENQLIFRDAYNVKRDLPTLYAGRGFRDFRLPDDKVLRVRVLHPDRPEQVSGADIIYERHNTRTRTASIVAVQYKLWENKILYLSDKRLKKQISRLKSFICDNGLCDHGRQDVTYRFPCCAAFIRPTDKLQNPDQKFLSSGEHLPICNIDNCTGKGNKGAEILSYDDMKEVSLSTETFEYLFNKGKIGSRTLTHAELERIYTGLSVQGAEENMIIYAQEFDE